MIDHNVVISASRRTDLVGCYPDVFVERLQEYPPEKIHTVVIWTKNPLPLFTHTQLYQTLKTYSQIVIHLTVTGMGGGIFEPHIPKATKVLSLLPKLVNFVGDPQRIIWRFDPIIHVKKGTKSYSNFSLFPSLSPLFAQAGIKTVKISWLSMYKKVIKNLGRLGWNIVSISLEEMKKQAQELETIAQAHNQHIEYCCVEGFPISRCIDGYVLNSLHPQGIVCSTKHAQGQRKLCGCTESIDIGWYNQICYHGCVYCYANPKI